MAPKGHWYTHAPQLIGVNLAGVFAGTLVLVYGVIRAGFGTEAAFHALALVDVGLLIPVKGDGAPLTRLFTPVGNAAPAGCGNFVAGDGALVAGNVDGFDNIGVVMAATHGQLHPLP